MKYFIFMGREVKTFMCPLCDGEMNTNGKCIGFCGKQWEHIPKLYDTEVEAQKALLTLVIDRCKKCNLEMRKQEEK